MDENRVALQKIVLEKHQLYKEFFDSEIGQKILDDLEDRFFIHRSTCRSDEPLDTFVRGTREGMRTVILYMRNMADDKQLKYLGINNETKEVV